VIVFGASIFESLMFSLRLMFEPSATT